MMVFFAEYHLFYRSLLQKRPIILRSLLIVATLSPQNHLHLYVDGIMIVDNGGLHGEMKNKRIYE